MQNAFAVIETFLDWILLASCKRSFSPKTVMQKTIYPAFKKIKSKCWLTTIIYFLILSPTKLHFRFQAPFSISHFCLFVLSCQNREFLFLCQGTLDDDAYWQVSKLQSLLFYIPDTNGKSYETNLLGLSTLNILENNIVNNYCCLCNFPLIVPGTHYVL